ncbi:hypothetical protein GVN21_20025 [Caulobacter sp. SLTY]|uniref:hypothetical protein n=1 Tax=Caulobacter sp. SLTY TaxID=2683262 RepID=UPI001411C69C|nr:hypothetical protein [Caulobacter sp. SLTY]NBB17655.1 hypothetical protein [Caulobacter sp. SLTY]
MGKGTLSLGDRVATVVWFLFGAGFLLAIPVLLSVSGWVLPILLGLAVAIALPISAIWRFALDRRGGTTFARRWVVVSVASLFVLGILAAAPVYYLSATVAARPLVAPQVTLSNGDKTIIFQGMAHVGSERFYKTVVYDLEQALADGYVAYYEGVTPDPAGDAWFSTTLANGGNLSAEYETLGKVCGLSFQGQYFQLLAQDIREHPDRHVVADVSTLQLKQEYERLIAADPDFAARVAKAADDKKDSSDNDDVLSGFLKWTQDGDGRHKALGGIVCRGVMGMILAPRPDKKPGDMDPLILDYRNRMLVDRIVADPRKRIYVNYGFDHFRGMYDLLKRSDPKWKVMSVKWMRVIEAPEELTGQL